MWAKENSKRLAAMQPDFGSGFLFKLAFNLKHSQKIGEHTGEHD